MRRWVLPLLCALLLSCSNDLDVAEISEPGRTVVPRSSGAIVLLAEAVRPPDIEPQNGLPELKVRLPAEYLPSQAINVNLDIDDSEEQIVVFKRRDDPDDLIRVLIVTYDPIRASWIRAWEGVTAATSLRTFTVYTDDLIGDHEQEIVAFGINHAGEQTLDVFRRTTNVLGLGLAYASILSITADVTVTIDQLERSEAYETMETVSARSFPVIAERRDLESEEEFDTIRTTYLWDFGARRYVPGPVERRPGEVIADARLLEMISGTEGQFEAFLSGPWYRASDAGDLQLVSFDPRSREVVFHRGYLQQVFTWDSSSKPVAGRGITLYVTNASIRTVKRLVSVAVQDANRINLSVQGADGLDGVYERLSGQLQHAVLAAAPRIQRSGIALSGLYRSDSGLEVVFSNPEFTYRTSVGVRVGGYALYSLGTDTIMSMRFVDENRLPTEHRDYRATFTQTSDDTRIIRTLTLEPGSVGVAGFAPNSEPLVVLAQVETIEQ